jgi:hypothetical protein
MIQISGGWHAGVYQHASRRGGSRVPAVLQLAEEARRYWEECNRERLAEIAESPPGPGQEELRAKLEEWKSRLDRPAEAH